MLRFINSHIIEQRKNNMKRNCVDNSIKNKLIEQRTTANSRIKGGVLLHTPVFAYRIS